MPAKKTTSSVNTALAKYAKDWDEVKTKPIDYGTREELPPGINNGVAQVTACKVDVYKRGPLQGELYFHAMARIITPETCYDPDLEKMVRVRGRFTTLGPLPICNQPDRDRTAAQNLDRVKNEIGKLGVDPSEIEITDLGTICDDITDSEVHIRYRTWRGEPTAQWPNPRTQEAWGGVIENYEEPEPDGDEAVDETAVDDDVMREEQEEKEESIDSFALAKAADNGDESAEEALTIRARNAGLTDEQIGEADSWVAVVEMIEPDVQALEETADSYESLGADADEGDEAAIERLTEEAEKAGLTDRDDFDDLSWSDVAKLLSEGGDADWQPKVEEIYLYKPPKARKAVECEVTKVNKHEATVTLRNLDDDTEYVNVNWSDLTEE